MHVVEISGSTKNHLSHEFKMKLDIKFVYFIPAIISRVNRELD